MKIQSSSFSCTKKPPKNPEAYQPKLTCFEIIFKDYYHENVIPKIHIKKTIFKSVTMLTVFIICT